MAQRQPALIVTLQELSVEGADSLIDDLLNEECLGAARAVCKALRDFVDGNMRALQLYINAKRLRTWEDGFRLPLERWPRCTAVKLTFEDNWGEDEEREDIATLLVLPFAGQPRAALQRITSLEVIENGEVRYEDDHIPEGPAIASLLSFLPALRELDITHLCNAMSHAAVQQHIMYGAIASLPYLTSLAVPCGSGLENVRLLADNLIRLEVFMAPNFEGPDKELSSDDVSAILQLRRLQVLHVHPRRFDWSDFVPPLEATSAGATRDRGLLPLLEGIGALADSLRDLELYLRLGCFPFTAAAADGISQLQRLRQLTLGHIELPASDSGAAASGLPQLLSAPPRSLEWLSLSFHLPQRSKLKAELVDCGAGRRCFKDIQLGSRASGVFVPEECNRLLQLLQLCRTMPGCKRLGCLELPLLGLPPAGRYLAVPGVPGSSDEVRQSVRDLLAGFERVELGCMQVCLQDLRNGAELPLLAMQLLGKPERLFLQASRSEVHDSSLAQLRIRRPGEPSMLAPADPRVAQEQRERKMLQLQTGPPAAEEVAKVALKRLVADAGAGSSAHPAPNLLLLQGPLIGLLQESSGEGFRAFLRVIRDKAAASLGGGGDPPRCTLSYQPLPPAAGCNAVLLECGEEAVEAVEAAVRAMAERHGAKELRVARVEAPPAVLWGDVQEWEPCKGVFTWALHQELQALWDDVAARRRVGEREWLRQLLGLWEQLGDLPARVAL